MIKLNSWEVPFKTFPDGTLNLLKGGQGLPCSSDTGLAVQDTAIFEWDFESVAEQVVLYNLVKHARYRGVRKMYLILPYIPNARMDRVHDVVMEVHTLKYFAEFLNDLHFDGVFVLDPHSDVSCTLINNVSVMSRASVFQKAVKLSQPDIVFYPDKGAMSRYDKDAAGLPYMYGDKDRNWADGTINGVIVQNPLNIGGLEDKKVLISDDISSKGGTFFYAGKALKDMGVKSIDLFITHCELSIYEGKLFTTDSPIDHVYTTSSIFKVVEGYEDRVTVIDLEATKREIYTSLRNNF